MSALVRPGDTVFTDDGNGPLMLEVLQPATAEPIEQRAVVTHQLGVAMARWRAGSRVWAVSGRAAMGERQDLAAFLARLSAFGKPRRQIAQGREVTLLLFDAPTPSAGTGPPAKGAVW